MTNKILTPVTMWEDFSIGHSWPEVVKTYSVDDIMVNELYVNRQIKAETVRIYAKMAYKDDFKSKPCILYLPDADEDISDDNLLEIARLGYVAVAMDIKGTPDDKAHTVYPESIAYAKGEEFLKDKFYIGKSAKDTAFYHWSVNARYILNYLKNLGVGKLCVFARGYTVTSAFHLGATEDLSALVALSGCGWVVPLGDKYGQNVKIDYSPEELKFIAGLEAQSYSAFLKCPTLMCVATNSAKFDIDRAYDTFSRIKEEIYSAIVYTVGTGNFLSNKAYNDVRLFLHKYLSDEDITLPGEIFIEPKITDKKITFNLKFDSINADTVTIYGSEGVIEPEYRCWKKLAVYTNAKDGVTCDVAFSPVQTNGIAFFYAEITYENGFTTCSPIMTKRFSTDDVECVPQFNVIFSCLEKYVDGVFEGIDTKVKTILGMKSEFEPVIQKVGPKGIRGIDASRGVSTFNVLKPAPDAMLMVDAFTKDETKIVFELVIEPFTANEKSYFATIWVPGGNVWNKLQIEQVKFKTTEGYPLKSYEKIKILKVYREDKNGELLINNLMWI